MTPSQIKHILKQYKTTQRDVAQKMGITPQSLYERLNGQEISISTLQGIAEALNISLSELWVQLGEQPINFPQDEVSMLRQENILLRQMLKEKNMIIEKLMQIHNDIHDIKSEMSLKK